MKGERGSFTVLGVVAVGFVLSGSVFGLSMMESKTMTQSDDAESWESTTEVA